MALQAVLLGLLMASTMPVQESVATAPDQPAVQTVRTNPLDEYADIKDWNVTKLSRYEVRVDDARIAFLGFVTEYQSPKDPHEFVRVISRHVALISVVREISQDEDVAYGVDLTKHNEKRESDALTKATKEADIIGFIRWRTVRDERTGRDYRSGPLESWLQDQSGIWTYRTDEKINRETHTEKLGPNVLLGIRFTLGDATQILSVDRQVLLDSLLKPKKAKDKPKSRKDREEVHEN